MKYDVFIAQYSNYMTPRIREAVDFAITVHQGQLRHGGEDYVEGHLFEMVSKLINLFPDDTNLENLIVLALLHDSVEDGKDIDFEKIEELFGLDISNFVRLLTKTKDENKHELKSSDVLDIEKRMARFIYEGGFVPTVVKLIDVWSNNQSTIERNDAKRYSRFIEKLEEVYLPLSQNVDSKIYDILKEQLDIMKSALSKLDFEIVKIDKSSGLDLYGELHRVNNSDFCVVLSHGITVDCHEKGVFDYLCKHLKGAGYNVLRFDYTGHGMSDGSTMDYSLSEAYEDLKVVFEFLHNNSFKKFVLLGASFSGGPVTQYTFNFSEFIIGLIYWNSLVDYSSRIHPTTHKHIVQWGDIGKNLIKEKGYFEVGSQRKQYSPKLMREVHEMNYANYIRDILCPILFVHGSNDVSVPLMDSYKHVQNMENVSLVMVEGAEHGFFNDPEYTKQATEAVLEFLNKLFIKHGIS